MQTGATTTGLRDFAIGSVEKFVLSVDLNGLPNSLAGGSATITFADPAANLYGPFAASIVGDDAQYTFMIIGPSGGWARSWTFTDANGVHQVSLPIPFDVVSSPV